MNYCEKCKRDLPDGEKCPVCAPKKGVFIEMKMPENCRECRFCRYDNKYEEYYCYANLVPMDITENVYEHIRQTQCPLQEVKE